jgi:hypothetical protein
LGLVAFFANRAVTNLDGLVNDDILPYAKSGTLAKYVLRRDLAYVIDYGAMLGRGAGERGGYSDGILVSCLTPEEQIDTDKPWEGSVLTLFKVDRDCLKAELRETPR